MCNEYTGIKLITRVVIGTECRGGCKSNYHAITPSTALFLHFVVHIYGKCYNMCRLFFYRLFIYAYYLLPALPLNKCIICQDKYNDIERANYIVKKTSVYSLNLFMNTPPPTDIKKINKTITTK